MNAAGRGTMSWFSRLNGALQIWVVPKACSVSPGRSFKVLHGVAKCTLFILASDLQSAEHFSCSSCWWAVNPGTATLS